MTGDLARVVDAAAGPTPELAVFDAFDQAARAGRLEELLAALREHPALPPLVTELLPYARTQPTAPLIIGHRGDPTNFVENTLEGISSAFDQRADAVELDAILVQRDDGGGYEVIARHDPDAGSLDSKGFYALVRNLGFEPWVYADDLFLARPTTPPLWRPTLRRPSYEHTLSSYRANFGYAEVKSWPMFPRILAAEIPTLGQVGARLAERHRDKLLFLDTKLPAGRPDLHRAMAGCIAAVVAEHHLNPGQIIIGNADAAILTTLRADLGSAYRYTHDEMLLGPFARAESASASKKATAFGTDLGDVGHVFWGSDRELLKVVERDVVDMHRANQELIVWTINDERMFRRLLGIGGRHGARGIAMVITDRPTAFRARLDRIYA